MADLDASELLALAAEIDVEAKKIAEKAYPLVKQQAMAFRRDWRANARQTVGKHGPHYPRAITAEQEPLSDAIVWEVGPESALPQGGMGRGFEYGSVHQPPHGDMGAAVTKREPLFNAAVEKLVKSFLA